MAYIMIYLVKLVSVMKKICCLLGLLLAVLCISACGANQSALKEIRDRGALRVGVKMDVPNFGYLNPETNTHEGLEIDIAGLIAKELLGDSNAVRLVGITAQTREPMLQNGELDMVIATYTITEERKKNFHFSTPYYQDAIGLMVLKGSNISDMNGLAGKSVGFAQFGTAEAAITEEAAARGIDIGFQKFASYPEGIAALLSGSVDAFAVDKSILTGYLTEETVILEETFRPQDYGIAMKKDNTALAKFVDDFFSKIEKDGQLKEIIDRWTD